MQDLVGVGVADSGVEMGIRERTFQRVPFSLEGLAEGLGGGSKDLEPAGIEFRE